jgi:nucleotide-binding universal stress UspA family protein
MIKSVLLHTNDDVAMDGRLQVALDVCRALNAHLTCLHVTPYNAYVAFDPFGGVSTQGAIMDSLRDSETKLRARIESRLDKEDVLWDWSSVDGEVAGTIVAMSALSDLVIISQACGATKGQNKPLAIVDDIAVHASCAVLVVPQGISQLHMNDEAVIGWNLSPEAAHAIRGAIPFLKGASFVHIASVNEDGEAYPQTNANTYLSRHGIKSDLHELAGTNREAAIVLHDFAVSKQASYLVMGAYGRSRFRETLLGGATRSLLSTSKIPLLLAH